MGPAPSLRRRDRSRTIRLFIALDIPEEWRAAARVTAAELKREAERDLRIGDPDSAHLTVRFLGDVDEGDLPLLSASLQGVGATPCQLRLGRAGTFGPPARTRVIWLGVEGEQPCLDRLALAVDGALLEAGLEVESQPWRPHLTLARVRSRVRPPERRALVELVRMLPTPDAKPFIADTLSLYRSHLADGPPRYELLTAVRFG